MRGGILPASGYDPAPTTKGEYRSPSEVGAAYKNGGISKSEAINILVRKFFFGIAEATDYISTYDPEPVPQPPSDPISEDTQDQGNGTEDERNVITEREFTHLVLGYGIFLLYILPLLDKNFKGIKLFKGR